MIFKHLYDPAQILNAHEIRQKFHMRGPGSIHSAHPDGNYSISLVSFELTSR